MKRRIEMRQVHGAQVAVIPSRNDWVSRIAVVFQLLAFWALAVASVLTLTQISLAPVAAVIGMVIIALLAVVIAALVTVDGFWKLYGSEELILTNESLTLTRSLFGVKNSRTFSVSRIRGIRVQERRTRRIVRRTIAFDYDGKHVSSTSQLSNEEGQALLEGPLRDLTGR